MVRVQPRTAPHEGQDYCAQDGGGDPADEEPPAAAELGRDPADEWASSENGAAAPGERPQRHDAARISARAASWSVVLAVELKVMEPYPTNARATSAIGRFGARPVMVMAAPQPRAVTASVEELRGVVRLAAISPPTIAPPAMKAAMTP